MFDTAKLYLHYVAISLRAQLQYRASFIIQTFAHFFITAIEFVSWAAMFARFGSLRGWTLAEIGLFYGIISIAFALAESIGRGFDVFTRVVRGGDFDRVLLRPRSTAFQIGASELQLMRLGRLSQAVIVLVICASALSVHWTVGRVLLVVLAILGGACLFTGLFVIQATLCFWTIESIEIVNCTTYGGVEAAQFPITIYRPMLRLFFTVVVPLATINYFPAQAILGRNDPLGTTRVFQWLSPVCGMIFLIVCLRFWNFGVRHYRSTGS